MNGGYGESLIRIRNKKKLTGDLFKNSSSKGANWETIFVLNPLFLVPKLYVILLAFAVTFG